MKSLYAFLIFLVLVLGNTALASSNQIPDSCKDTAERYLIRGDYSSSSPGARLWRIDQIVKDRGSNKSDACLKAIGEQVYRDSSEYWQGINKKFDCIDSAGNYRTTAKCTKPALELEYAKYSGHLMELNSTDASHSCINTRPNRAMLTEMQKALDELARKAPEPKPVEIPPATLKKLAEESGACDKVPAEMKNCSNDANLMVSAKCLGSYFVGIGTDLWDNAKGIVDLAKMIPKVPGAIGYLAHAGKEAVTHPKQTYDTAQKNLKKLTDELAKFASEKYAQFNCMCIEAQSKLLCKAVGYLTSEVGLAFVGVAELTALAKGAKAGSFVAKVGEALDKAHLAILGKAAMVAEEVGSKFRYLREVAGGAAMRFMESTAAGVEVAIERGKSFIRREGKIYEVTDAEASRVIQESVKVAERAPTASAAQGTSRATRSAASAESHMRPPEFARQLDDAHFKRYGEDPLDPKYAAYLQNGRESLTTFEHYFEGPIPSDPAEYRKAFEKANGEMHRVATTGQDGSRAYKAERPGQLRVDDSGMRSVRQPAADYADALAQKYGLGKRPDGRALKINGIPEDASPYNIGAQHYYPAGTSLQAYYDQGAKLMSQIQHGIREGGNPEEIRKLIGEYYHVMVNARPYEQVNNSLFMTQVNYMLRRTGHAGLSHGEWDHVFMRLDSAQADVLWKQILTGNVPSARSLGIAIK